MKITWTAEPHLEPSTSDARMRIRVAEGRSPHRARVPCHLPLEQLSCFLFSLAHESAGGRGKPKSQPRRLAWVQGRSTAPREAECLESQAFWQFRPNCLPSLEPK